MRRVHGGDLQESPDHAAFPARGAGREVETQGERDDAEQDGGEDPERRPDAEQLSGDRGDDRAEHEAGDVERGEPAEVVPDVVGIAGDDNAADRRAHRAAPESEQQPREDERPELGGDGASKHRERGDDHPAAHHERDPAAVRVPREEELRAEAGEESGRDDQSELGVGEAETLAEVGEQRVDGSVSERHAARHEAERQQRAVPCRQLRHPGTPPSPATRSTK